MINFREVVIISFVFTMTFILVEASPAAADPWALKKYPAEGFQVEWSGPVKESEVYLPPEKKKLVDHSTQYLQDSGSSAYIVNSQKNNYSTLFDQGSKASFDTFHCKSIIDKPLDMAGVKAKEMVGTDCDNDLRIRARYFVDGKWFYQVIAVMNPSGDLDAGQHFVEAFKLIKK